MVITIILCVIGGFLVGNPRKPRLDIIGYGILAVAIMNYLSLTVFVHYQI